MKIVSTVAGLALVASALGVASTAAAAPEQPQKRAGAWKVTAKINKDVVISREDVIKVKGRVTPKAAGQKLLVQQRLANQKSWKKAGVVKVKANGTYLFKDKPSATGPRRYRVIKAASNGLRKGVSKPVSTHVYEWRTLSSFSDSASQGTELASGSVASEWAYPILTLTEGASAGYAEYTLGRKCVSLEATYAMLDKSPTGTSGSVAISSDGTARATHALTIGTLIEDTTLDLTDVYRLKFDFTATSGGYPGVVEPHVLCS